MGVRTVIAGTDDASLGCGFFTLKGQLGFFFNVLFFHL